MNIKDLRELYFSNKNICCKCGCQVEDSNGKLGSVFVLDMDGNFYCTNCDSEVKDEEIFDADLYPVTRVKLICANTVTDDLYVYAEKEEIEKCLYTARDYVYAWLSEDDKLMNTIPENYDWCVCDQEFYQEALQSNFKVEYIEEDDILEFCY